MKPYHAGCINVGCCNFGSRNFGTRNVGSRTIGCRNIECRNIRCRWAPKSFSETQTKEPSHPQSTQRPIFHGAQYNFTACPIYLQYFVTCFNNRKAFNPYLRPSGLGWFIEVGVYRGKEPESRPKSV